MGSTVMELRELWRRKLLDRIESLAFSEKGTLAATSGECAYVFDENGKLVKEVCGRAEMFGASFNKLFGFANVDNTVYLTDEYGNLKKTLTSGDECNESLTVLDDGVIACRYKCSLINFDNEKLWKVEVGHVPSGPAVLGKHAYAADEEREGVVVIDVEKGEVVAEHPLGEEAYDAKACNGLLAVGTASSLYLMKIDGKELKKLNKVEGFLGAWSVAFSPDCAKVAVTDFSNFALKVLDLEGNLLAQVVYEYPGSEELEGSEPHAVAWKGDKLAVGLRDGHVIVYKVS